MSPLSRRLLPLIVVATLLLSLPAAAQTGGSETVVRAACAAFAWQPTDGALAYELVVVELGGASAESAPPVVEVAVAADETSWEPAAGECLEPGRYVWTVRPVTPLGTGDWAEPVLFEVPGDGGDEPSGAEQTNSEGEEPQADADDEVAADDDESSEAASILTPRRDPEIDLPTRESLGGGRAATEEEGDDEPSDERARMFEAIRRAPISGAADMDAMLADARRGAFDYEIVSTGAYGLAGDSILAGEDLQLGVDVRVNGAAPDDPVSFYVGVADQGDARAEVVTDRLDFEGPGPHSVRIDVPVQAPLLRGDRIDGVVQVMTGRRIGGVGDREIVVRQPVEDADNANHFARFRYDVERPDVELVSVERIGEGLVETGDLVELEVEARLHDAGDLRYGFSYAVGDLSEPRVDTIGPKVFLTEGDHGDDRATVTMRFRVEPQQIVDDAFRADVFLLADAPPSVPFSERVLRDGDTSNNRRRIVYPTPLPRIVEDTDRYRGVHKDCKSAAKMASDLWKQFRAEAKEAGCLSPLKYTQADPRKRSRSISACFVEGTRLPAKIADNMVGHWNDLAQGGWATLGPRRILPGINQGTVLPLTQRLFLGTAPAGSAGIDFELEKVDGKASARITVCQNFSDGSSAKVLDVEVPPRSDDGYTVSRMIESPEPSILSVKVDHSGGPVGIPTFSYELKVEEIPRIVDLPPVDGFADLHLHQMARLAHAGHWFWGDHDGPRHEALTECDHTDHAVPEWVPELVLRHGKPDEYTYRAWPHWDDVAHQQVYADWLKQAHDGGLNLAVVSMVNFEPLCYILKAMHPNKNTNWGCGDMPNIMRQIEAAHEFDKEHDWYEIALNPWHARQIIARGNLAVVLSVEASHIFPSRDGDVSKQLADLYFQGVRTLQIAHETDSRFAGAAPHREVFGAFQKIKHPLAGGLSLDGFNLDEDGKNRVGLKREGERLVRLMMDYGMPIDLAHLSERTVEDIWRIARDNRHYPLYNSHTRFKPVLNTADREEQREFLSTCRQVSYIERSGGMVGLRTGDNALRGVSAGEVPNDCPGSSKSFGQMIEFGNHYSSVEMGLGTDLNGFISQVAPRYGADACAQARGDGNLATFRRAQGDREDDSWFHTKGLSHVGLLPDLVDDLDRVGADTSRLRRSAEAYLQMWERAMSGARQPQSSSVDCSRWVGF